MNANHKKPVAPPPFRPVIRKPPVAPPVYNPHQRQNGVQAKIAVGPQRPVATAPVVKRPVAPPVYRPQQVPKVLQRKQIAQTQVTPKRVAPLPRPTQRTGATAQLKIQNKLHHNRVVQAKPAPPIAAMKNATARVARPAPAGTPRSNTVQRLIMFTHGARLRQNNVAASIANMVDYGITKTTLNGSAYPGGTKENFVTSMLSPTLSVEKGSLGGVAVSVQSVPVQQVSYLMELPTNGPWQLRVAAANIKVKLGNQPIMDGVHIPIEAEDAGDLTLQVRGLPTDAIFADLVETHEDVHVADIQSAINDILKPWDARLSHFRNHGTRFEGFTQETATARLYEAAGGTPREIADRFVTTLRQMGNVFHNTDAGKAPTIVAMTRSGPAEDSTLNVYLKHRAGLISLHEQKLAAIEERVRREQAIYQRGLSASLAQSQHGVGSISGPAGNPYINDDML